LFGYGSLLVMWLAVSLGMMSSWMHYYLPYAWFGWLLASVVVASIGRRISLTAVRL
jgi:hypothetical protein